MKSLQRADIGLTQVGMAFHTIAECSSAPQPLLAQRQEPLPQVSTMALSFLAKFRFNAVHYICIQVDGAKASCV